MYDHAPRPTGSDLEALNDSELRALLARVQSELGRRAMSESILDTSRSRAIQLRASFSAADSQILEPVGSKITNRHATTAMSRSEVREVIGIPLAQGLRKRNVIRRFNRWRKEKHCEFVYIDGGLLDSMSLEGVKSINAFYSIDPDSSDQQRLQATYVMKSGEN